MKLSSNKGFTIIEVIIVLVVGAVIMISVFLVVPQLQQTSRNSLRNADARRILVAMQQFETDGGVYPSANLNNNVTTQFNNYLSPAVKTTEGTLTAINYRTSIPSGGLLQIGGLANIYIFKDTKCEAGKLVSGIGNRAVAFPIEPKGSTNFIMGCISS